MSTIKVALRARPLSTRERDEGYPVVVEVDENSAFITDIRVPEKPAADSRCRYRQFDFDHAFWLKSEGNYGASQEEVYNEMGPSLEKSILDGYNACLLAYGQSGTGKTHTMLGTKADPGLIPRLCQSLWNKLRESRENYLSFRMEVSFMEIYREKVRDLLTPDKPLKLRYSVQNGPHVQDLTRVEVSEEISLTDLLWEGEKRRAMGQTGSNRRSSRSHAIWTLYLTYHKPREGNGTDGTSIEEQYDQLITNQVHLVDLAGSEKAEYTTTKNLLAEGADINRSLVSLGNVISSLAEKAQYIPYRDSALTWLLKDSLGGNATTSIIITASPASLCHAQTLNSLRFAQRARLVENQPTVNLTSSYVGQGASDYLSIASLFDIRKDISRLANILNLAKTQNGGILRGLTPRNGWNRLINAIENWNVQEKAREEREDSNGRPLQQTTSTSTASTMTTNSSTKSLSDVMIQADLQYEDARSCSSVSVPTSPCRTNNNNSSSSNKNSSNNSSSSEVFPPIANSSSSASFKCLTWAQPEIESLPKPSSSDESEDEFISPPQTPQVKVHHMKYVVPIRVATTHNVESEGRIQEKIHRSFNCEYPDSSELAPKVVSKDEGCENTMKDDVLIREKVPTLVNPQNLNIFETDQNQYQNHHSTSLNMNSYYDDCGKQSAHFTSNNNDSSSNPNSHSNSPCGDYEFEIPLALSLGNGSDLITMKTTSPTLYRNVVEETSAHVEFSLEDSPGFQFPVQSRPRPRLVLAKGSSKKRTHRPASKIKEFLQSKPPICHGLESTDECEFSDALEIQLNHSDNKNLRTVNFQKEVKVQNTFELNNPDCGRDCDCDSSCSSSSSLQRSRSSRSGSTSGTSSSNLDSDDSGTKKGKSAKSSSSNSSSSASSSYASLVVHQPVARVKIVENNMTDFRDLDEASHLHEMKQEELDLNIKGLERKVAAVSFGQVKEVEDDLDMTSSDHEHDNDKKKPIDGTGNTAFRNFYVRELQQLDQIGRQIKSLQHLAQRYDVLKPYLRKIEDLHNTTDFSEPDPELDAHIEHCSGWNVDIEYNKVQNEVLAISKILKSGNHGHGLHSSSGMSIPKLPRRDSSSASNHSAASPSHLTSTSSASLNNNSDRDSFAFTFNPQTMNPNLNMGEDPNSNSNSNNSRRGSCASSNVFEPRREKSSTKTMTPVQRQMHFQYNPSHQNIGIGSPTTPTTTAFIPVPVPIVPGFNPLVLSNSKSGQSSSDLDNNGGQSSSFSGLNYGSSSLFSFNFNQFEDHGGRNKSSRHRERKHGKSSSREREKDREREQRDRYYHSNSNSNSTSNSTSNSNLGSPTKYPHPHPQQHPHPSSRVRDNFNPKIHPHPHNYSMDADSEEIPTQIFSPSHTHQGRRGDHQSYQHQSQHPDRNNYYYSSSSSVPNSVTSASGNYDSYAQKQYERLPINGHQQPYHNTSSSSNNNHHHHEGIGNLYANGVAALETRRGSQNKSNNYYYSPPDWPPSPVHPPQNFYNGYSRNAGTVNGSGSGALNGAGNFMETNFPTVPQQQEPYATSSPKKSSQYNNHCNYPEQFQYPPSSPLSGPRMSQNQIPSHSGIKTISQQQQQNPRDFLRQDYGFSFDDSGIGAEIDVEENRPLDNNEDLNFLSNLTESYTNNNSNCNGLNSPYRSLSLSFQESFAGPPSLGMSINSFCKSCSNDFCSCEESMSTRMSRGGGTGDQNVMMFGNGIMAEQPPARFLSSSRSQISSSKSLHLFDEQTSGPMSPKIAHKSLSTAGRHRVDYSHNMPRSRSNTVFSPMTSYN